MSTSLPTEAAENQQLPERSFADYLHNQALALDAFSAWDERLQVALSHLTLDQRAALFVERLPHLARGQSAAWLVAASRGVQD